MTTDRPPIVIIDAAEAVPEHAVVIQRHVQGHFTVLETGKVITLENGRLWVSAPLTDNISGPGPMGKMQVEAYQFVTAQGHTVKIVASGTGLICKYI